MKLALALLLLAAPVAGQVTVSGGTFGGLTFGSSAAQARGYVAQACGFGGDYAGCTVCDGSTADPDGDGTEEDINYVDCDAGVDDVNCGAAGDPCGSVSYAMAGSNSSYAKVANGPGDGAEDIVCFKGTCDLGEDVTTSFDGVTATRTVAASGSEKRAFEYPADPFILSGWDADGDGEYPPYDTDDTAILDDGTGAADTNSARAFLVQNSYLEMAHFTAQSFGSDDDWSTDDGGFAKVSDGTAESHTYYHDIELVDINRDNDADGTRIVFNTFNFLNDYLAVENVKCTDCGSFFVRGSSPDTGPTEYGPIRFQNVSLTMHGCDESGGGICAGGEVDAYATVWKTWGYMTGIEILDSVFDANTANWIPRPSGGPHGAEGIAIAQCTQDAVIRNNEFVNMKQGVVGQGETAASCTARTLDDLVVDRNIFRNNYAPWVNGDVDISIRADAAGGPVTNTVEDVTITNNFFSSSVGREAHVSVDVGNDASANPGTVTIAHNTFDSTITSGGGAIWIEDPSRTHPQNTFVVSGNIITGVSAGDECIHTDYAPSSWSGDYSVFDADCDYEWNAGAQASLANWRTASGADANSDDTCSVSFAAGAATGEYPLDSGDTCAKDIGPTAPCPATTDFDGESRPSGANCDAGADEQQ